VKGWPGATGSFPVVHPPQALSTSLTGCIACGAGVVGAVPAATCRCLQQLYEDVDLSSPQKLVDRCGITDPGKYARVCIVSPLVAGIYSLSLCTNLLSYKQTTQITSDRPANLRAHPLMNCGGRGHGLAEQVNRKGTPHSHTQAATKATRPGRLEDTLTYQ